MEADPTRTPAALGTRLRRLSERIDREVQDIYRAAGVDFEPRWYPVFVALRDGGPATVGELAQHIGVTHAAVSQVRAALADRGLVQAASDPADQRRQVLQLTDKGRRRAAELAPLWSAIVGATDALCADAAPALVGELTAVEDALAEETLKARVQARLDGPQGRRSR